jgi:hypothetical protein
LRAELPLAIFKIGVEIPRKVRPVYDPDPVTSPIFNFQIDRLAAGGESPVNVLLRIGALFMTALDVFYGLPISQPNQLLYNGQMVVRVT